MERFLCNENFVLTPAIDPNPAINHREKRVVGKNGNGEGNIRRRPDGRWEARYCVETTEGLKRRSVYSWTRQDVANKLTAKIANKATELVEQATTEEAIKVRDFFGEYLAAVKDTIKRRSCKTSDDIIRLHLNPEFGGMNLTVWTESASKPCTPGSARVYRLRGSSA